jgi:hypothetical protein
MIVLCTAQLLENIIMVTKYELLNEEENVYFVYLPWLVCSGWCYYQFLYELESKEISLNQALLFTKYISNSSKIYGLFNENV